jgi:hypothetical protein
MDGAAVLAPNTDSTNTIKNATVRVPANIACPLTPKSFAAAMAVAGAGRFADGPGKWRLARTLIEELGPPGEDVGPHTGSGKKLRALVKALEEEAKRSGIKPLSYSYLDKIWKLGWAFRDANILASVSFTAYFNAGKPDVFEGACHRIEEEGRKRDTLGSDDVKRHRKLDAIERAERDRKEHPALRGSNREVDLAVINFSMIAPNIEKLIDKAINWLKPHVDKLSDPVRHDLIGTLISIRGKIDDGISLLKQSEVDYQEAAE